MRCKWRHMCAWRMCFAQSDVLCFVCVVGGGGRHRFLDAALTAPGVFCFCSHCCIGFERRARSCFDAAARVGRRSHLNREWQRCAGIGWHSITLVHTSSGHNVSGLDLSGRNLSGHKSRVGASRLIRNASGHDSSALALLSLMYVEYRRVDMY